MRTNRYRLLCGSNKAELPIHHHNQGQKQVWSSRSSRKGLVSLCRRSNGSLASIRGLRALLSSGSHVPLEKRKDLLLWYQRAQFHGNRARQEIASNEGPPQDRGWDQAVPEGESRLQHRLPREGVEVSWILLLEPCDTCAC